MNYVIDEISLHENHAGSKARDDVNFILENNGFVLKSLNYSYGGSIFKLLNKFFNETKDLKKILKSFKKGDMVLIQHPLICYSTHLGEFIKKTSKKKGYKTVLLIHDLDELRFDKFLGKFKKGKFSNMVRDEISYLDSFDYIISHNCSMTNYIKSKGIDSKKLIDLQLFDYIANIPENDSEKNVNRHVVIAGNLDVSKAGYIYKLKDIESNIYNFELYGVNYSGENNNFCHYNGSFKPEELLMHINNGFGLIWDGDSLGDCTGILGRYTRYNNPHKLSLYIACGIPVIVWKKAAIAKFGLDPNMGYTVNSLSEIESLLSNINDYNYKEFKNNVINIQRKVLKGSFLIDSIKEIEKRENEEGK